MSTNSADLSSKELQSLQDRIVSLQNERDFIKNLYDDMPQIFQMLSKRAPLNSSLNFLKKKLQTLLPKAYCLFLVSDETCATWRLESSDSISDTLLNSNHQLTSVPQDIITFAATPSRAKQDITDIQMSPNWEEWRSFCVNHSFENVSMVSVSDGLGSIYLTLVFQKSDSTFNESLMALALDGYVSWVDSAFKQEKADHLLLENSYEHPKTRLLRRYSFENNFNIILKDSRRHLQRIAFFSIRLLLNSQTSKTQQYDGQVDVNELIELTDLIKSSIRENDLIGHYGEQELVMGIRIQRLEDAEVVATKLLESLQRPEYSGNALIRAGFSIGIAFYPEHSSFASLYQAAISAEKSLNNTVGYRFEYHSKFYGSSLEYLS